MTLPRPTVSVVIPCHNAERFVAESIASALAQTYPVEEVICVDDGSADGTLTVLRRAEEQTPGRLVVLSRPNGGPSAARNLGLRRATGDYVQFLDADDILQPDKIERQVRLIEASDPLPDLVAAAYTREYLYAERHEVVGVDEDPWMGLFSSRLGITSANLYRRAAVLEVGGWNEGMKTSEDPELAFRLLKRRQRVLLDSIPRTVLRRRLDSQWNADDQASMRGWLRLRMDALEWVRKGGLLTRRQMVEVERTVFRVIRTVYAYDSALAEAAFRTLSRAFRPPREEHGKAYVLLYRTLGFRVAQRLHPYGCRFGAILHASRSATSRPFRVREA